MEKSFIEKRSQLNSSHFFCKRNDAKKKKKTSRVIYFFNIYQLSNKGKKMLISWRNTKNLVKSLEEIFKVTYIMYVWYGLLCVCVCICDGVGVGVYKFFPFSNGFFIPLYSNRCISMQTHKQLYIVYVIVTST